MSDINMINEKELNEIKKKEQVKSQEISPQSYDAIVIGAGLCGIIFLAYARKKGLRCIALEKQNDVGGLWNNLPTWQDIQNRKQDISIDNVPLNGIDQPAMHQYALEWIKRYNLDSFIHLKSEVTDVSRVDDKWSIRTKQEETFRTNYLIIASGVQNEPWIPYVDRKDSKIKELHSYDLRQLEELKNKRVTIVGGGASSQDLLDLAIEYSAKEIHWVYRNNIKWFFPTKKSKQFAWPNLRELALGQSIHGTKTASTLMRWLLRFRYNKFGISELITKEPFDFDWHQLIPGRYSVIKNLEMIYRHRAQVRSLHEKTLLLSNGESFETDQILWGTGYNINLHYLNLPEFDQIKKLHDLYPKLASLVKSVDYPNLFFLGMALINSSSSTTLFAAVESKTIISHIKGECKIPDKKFPSYLTHWDLIRYFATFDRANYPKWWKLKYLWLTLCYEIMQNRSIRIGTG